MQCVPKFILGPRVHHVHSVGLVSVFTLTHAVTRPCICWVAYIHGFFQLVVGVSISLSCHDDVAAGVGVLAYHSPVAAISYYFFLVLLLLLMTLYELVVCYGLDAAWLT